jgi:hypothetical protein
MIDESPGVATKPSPGLFFRTSFSKPGRFHRKPSKPLWAARIDPPTAALNRAAAAGF